MIVVNVAALIGFALCVQVRRRTGIGDYGIGTADSGSDFSLTGSVWQPEAHPEALRVLFSASRIGLPVTLQLELECSVSDSASASVSASAGGTGSGTGRRGNSTASGNCTLAPADGVPHYQWRQLALLNASLSDTGSDSLVSRPASPSESRCQLELQVATGPGSASESCQPDSPPEPAIECHRDSGSGWHSPV